MSAGGSVSLARAACMSLPNLLEPGRHRNKTRPGANQENQIKKPNPEESTISLGFVLHSLNFWLNFDKQPKP
jgi:hypothetical protein